VADEMSRDPIYARQGKGLELPVAGLLRCARPLPPHDDMVIEDLTTEEGDPLLAALDA
jgi:hypothetical protein